MKQEILKSVFFIIAAVFIITTVFTIGLPAQAATADELLWGGQEDDVQSELKLGSDDPRVIAAKIVNVFLGFLGIIAVIIILLGGFKWMMAQGNDEKVNEAKKLIMAGVIGLIIIVASFAIAKFVVSQLFNATNAGY